MTRCPLCLSASPQGATRCVDCGEDLLPPCPACRAPRGPVDRACARCGEPLPEANPEAAPEATADSIRTLRAFQHPRERRAYSDLVESPGLFALVREGRPSRYRATPPARKVEDLPGITGALVRARGLGWRRRVVDGADLRVVDGHLEVGSRLAAAWTEDEADFLSLQALYPALTGLDRYLELMQLAPATPASRRGAELLASWARYLAFTADRFAMVLTGMRLDLAARALFKRGVLAGEAEGVEMLPALERFRRADEGFEAIKQLLRVLPRSLERAWELAAFQRSPLADALEGLSPTTLLGIEAETSSALESPVVAPPRAAPVAVRVVEAPAAPPAGREAAPPQAVPRRRLVAVDSSPAAPTGSEAVFYLSAYRRDLRVRQGGDEVVVPLDKHLRLPVRLAVDAAGVAWVADGEGGQVLRLGADGTPEALLETGVRRPGPMATTATGGLMIADRSAGRVQVLGPDGRVRRTLEVMQGPSLGEVSGLAPTPDGGCWVSDLDHGRVLRLDGEGAVMSVLSGIERPGDLALTAEGGVWVAETAGGRLLRFGPTGVRQQVLALGVGRELGEGVRVRVGADGGLVALDPDRPRILSWAADLRPRGEILDLAAPEDRFGYFCDLGLGPALATRQVAPEAREEEAPCVRSISS